ncbi:hypothetical protein O1D97_00800 [Marinomonas sp. 15G1-11]|uniref:Uncharacterized protein n=1 Tax=Marinomonas phaeophyticola TaxID=3004091 RepID=A0ABT4JPC8_9GAMM|nr:hypothetical protein [Marinomonas sp. 15G1-11]MCZ2720215.1 hypothetical protein [Marinomonas sp. 15G1-11]
MIKQCALGAALCILITGCSTLTDHREDYKTVKTNSDTLQYPEGIKAPIDRLYIPNEGRIAHLDDIKVPQIPAPPTIYHALTPVHISSTGDHFQLIVPASVKVTENLLTNFLTGMYGDGDPIRSNIEGSIETQVFTSSSESRLASIWRAITRLPSKGIALQYKLAEQLGGTKIEIRYRNESSDGVVSEWASPEKSQFAETSVVRLWGVLGKQLSDNAVFLSSQSSVNTTPLWVDHRGHFVLRLNDNNDQSIDSILSMGGLYLLSTAPNTLSLKPEAELPKIGDIVDFKIPFITQDESKPSSIKSRRRNLDDVEWDEKIYNFKIDANTLGKFLVIDFSDVDYPELRSYQVMSRFINPS